MLFQPTRGVWYFAQLAASSAARFREATDGYHRMAPRDGGEFSLAGGGESPPPSSDAEPAITPGATPALRPLVPKTGPDVHPLWIDDVEGERRALEAHHRSAAYRELHRPALTTSAMGLFGGEPGFEKAHRVWVDPDRPHMKHIYNQTALAKNLRYSRYGYFKRDMHLLDVDKLIRHARLLPTPNRLLGDFLYQRVALSDKSCAAFLRYQRQQLERLESWRRGASLRCGEEMFERMAVTNLPPVDLGPLAHAEMIRCCAVCGEWHKGWEVYYRRALEVEEEGCETLGASAGADAPIGDAARLTGPSAVMFLRQLRERSGMEEEGSLAGRSVFVLGTAFFDAVLELCVACERPEEGMEVLQKVISRHLRPMASMVNKGMVLVSIAVEVLDDALESITQRLSRSSEETDGVRGGEAKQNGAVEEDWEKRLNAVLPGWADTLSPSPEAEKHRAEIPPPRPPLVSVEGVEVLRALREHYRHCGKELWSLFDFYGLHRTTQSMEAFMRLGAALNEPLMVMEGLRFADASAETAAAVADEQIPSLSASAARVGEDGEEGPTRATLTCMHYLVYGLRSVRDFGDFILEMFTRLSARGLQADYILFTLAFQYCARHQDGTLAMALYEQHWVSSGCNATPEIALAFARACAECEEPAVRMLTYAERLVEDVERTGSPHFRPAVLYDALIALAGEVGAVAAAFSKMKVLASYGVPELLTTRTANSLLMANANAPAPNGSVNMTEEIARLFRLLQVSPNDDTIRFLEACLEAFGTTDGLSAWLEELYEKRSQAGGTLGSDADAEAVAQGRLELGFQPPHRMRRLQVSWNLSPRDIVLSRFGQHSKPKGKLQVGSMLGSVVPFGRTPGEQSA